MTAQRRPRKSCGKSRRQHRTNITWVRTPIKKPRGRHIRVLIYARYSTDDQNPRSIPAQVEYAKQFLEDMGVGNYELDILKDKGVSGEQISRPGINKAKKGIAAGRWT